MTSISNSTRSNPVSVPPDAQGSAVDFGRQQLRHWMQQCRQSTLALFESVDQETLCCQAHPDFSPIGWHLGHIAYTESLWILEHCAAKPPQFPQYRRLFAADGLPKTDRVHLPSLAEIQAYLSTIRTQVFDYLEIAPLEQQERLWRWLLQHESQHCETIAIVLEMQRVHQARVHQAQANQAEKAATAGFAELPAPRANPALESAMVCIPAGEFECGNESLDALDNERPVHRVPLETYWIDRYPVTCGQYRVFMAAGGYQDSRWWSPQGWEWLQTVSVQQPLYWVEDPAYDLHPVYGVSWYEADAYARFVGKRLPTEAEWEKAASWNSATQQRQTYPWGEAFPSTEWCNHHPGVGGTTAIDRYPRGQSPAGCYDMLGNVWEWTASWFDGYAGFEAYLYRGYSQTYFDGQHRVLRGGSWATRSWALRCAFRNWYYPQVREILAGFRCAADSPPA